MKRGRAVFLSLAVAASAVAGLLAVRNSVALGTQARGSTTSQIATRSAQLDRYQASLSKALSKQPPALPVVPVPLSETGARLASPARVVYRRPAPVVVQSVRRDDDGEVEDEQEEYENEQETGPDNE